MRKLPLTPALPPLNTTLKIVRVTGRRTENESADGNVLRVLRDIPDRRYDVNATTYEIFDLLRGHVGDHRSFVVAVVARKEVGTAEEAVETPGQRRTVPGAGEGVGFYEVRAQ